MNPSQTDLSGSRVPLWIRAALVILGAPNAVAGLWAIVSPREWFETFPGFDPRLVAAEPPYNAHLATDAGAGLFASGLVMLAAAWLADRRSVRLALAAFAAFAVPHAAYHVMHPASELTTAQNIQNGAMLIAAIALAAGLFVATGRRGSSQLEREPEREEERV